MGPEQKNKEPINEVLLTSSLVVVVQRMRLPTNFVEDQQTRMYIYGMNECNMTMTSTTIVTMAAFFIRLLGVGNLEALKFNIFNRQSPRLIKSFYFGGKPILLLPLLTIDLPPDKFLGDGLVMFSTCFVCLLDWFLLVSLFLSLSLHSDELLFFLYCISSAYTLDFSPMISFSLVSSYLGRIQIG